jgi:hypothetical protein
LESISVIRSKSRLAYPLFDFWLFVSTCHKDSIKFVINWERTF